VDKDTDLEFVSYTNRIIKERRMKKLNVQINGKIGITYSKIQIWNV
jgi:hypothetical protein